MAKDKEPDKRPPVTTPPGGMAPPPPAASKDADRPRDGRPPVDTTSIPGAPPTGPDHPTKGPTIQANEDAGKQLTENPPTDHRKVADGQIGGSEDAHVSQPMRPDATTQGSRPDVGGSAPVQTHPDRPDIAGVAPEDLPAAAEPESLRDARKRAGKSGNVYRVTGTPVLTTGHTGHITESDIPGGSFDWLVKIGALEPVGELKSDPTKARSLGPDGLEEVDRMQERVESLEDENDKLREENARLKRDNAKLAKNGH